MAWNPTPVTEVWTALGIVGVVISGFNLSDAFQDRKALRLSGKHSEALNDMAQNGIRVEVIRLSKMLAIVGVGIGAILSAPQITHAQRVKLHIPTWTPIGIILTVMLFYIIVAIVIQAFMDAKLRHRFYRNHTESRTQEVNAEMIARRTAELLLGEPAVEKEAVKEPEKPQEPWTPED